MSTTGDEAAHTGEVHRLPQVPSDLFVWPDLILELDDLRLPLVDPYGQKTPPR